MGIRLWSVGLGLSSLSGEPGGSGLSGFTETFHSPQPEFNGLGPIFAKVASIRKFPKTEKTL